MKSATMTVAVVILAGCAVTPPPGGEAADLPFPTFQRGDGAPEALLEGKLVLEDGCLAVDSEVGAYAVVLPDDATWDADAQAVTIDRSTFEVGDQVSFGGGYSEIRSVDLEHRCVHGDEIFYAHTVA